MVAEARTPLLRERELLVTAEMDAALARSVRLAATALRVPVVLLGVPEGEQLRLLAQVGVPDPWARAGALPLASMPCRHAFPQPTPLVIESLETHPLTRDDPPLDSFPRGGYCGMTLRVTGEPVAVLAVLQAEPRQWTADELSLLGDVCTYLAHDLEQLAGAAPAARAGAELLAASDWAAPWRSLLEHSGAGIFVADRAGRLVEGNATALRLLGASVADVRELDLSELCVRREEWQAFQRDLELHGAAGEREMELRRRDGSEAFCVFSAVVRRSAEGEILGFQGAIRDVTEQRQAERRLLESALHDPLTRLPNRTLLLDRLERLLRHTRRRAGYRFALLFIDLDRFKVVNDTQGHLMGDRLLIAVSRRLAACVRQEDTVARIGGDEFAVLLDAIADAAGVIQVAERILQELAQPFEELEQPGIGASVGIALSMTGYESVDEVLRDADTAMYRAKGAGGSGYAVFDTEMYGRMRAQLELESELRQALGRNQLSLYYHPVVALDGGRVTGMEALLRWVHPERGVLLPDDFIPLAERSGLIVEIGWWVLRQACHQLRAWCDEYPEAATRLTMSVNLSARQFLQPEVAEQVGRILAETQVDPQRLRLDITEASVTQNAPLAERLLTDLQQLGVQICIDDFGTGYSSLNELRRLPISGIKIAPRFVRELSAPEQSSHAVVQTIIALGRSLAIDAIAEGVETPEQLDQLRALGTRFAQGFLFSLPLDSERARALIAH